MATPVPSGMTRKTARYGWTPDLPDARDHLFSAPAIALAALPPSADLRNGCPPVYNQGQIGSCTANAIAAAVAWLPATHPRPSRKRVRSWGRVDWGYEQLVRG